MASLNLPKSLLQSKTFWVNVITAVIAICTALMGQDFVSNNPAAVAYFTAGIGVLNIVLRLVTSAPIKLFALLLALLICGSAQAQNALLVGQRAAVLKQYLPAVDDPALEKILQDPQTILYTENEIPRVVGMWQGVNGIARRIIAAEDNRDPGSHQFPWTHPAGTDDVKNMATVRFLSLPVVNGVRQPVAWFRNRIPPDSAAAYQWIFPVGTTIGEVLAMPGSDGFDYPFELRIRYRQDDFWEVDVFRPFATPVDFAVAIKERRPNWRESPRLLAAVGALEGPANLGRVTLSDRQPLRPIIRQEAGWDIVPDLGDPKLLGELLRGTRFTSVYGIPWRRDGKGVEAYAPGSQVDFNLVPKGYTGAAVKVDAVSCARCHETTGHHVNEFAEHTVNYPGFGARHWYGRIRGSDGIFSFHPFDPAYISDTGAREPVIRQSLVQAGAVAAYDPAKHSADRYKFLKAFDPRYNATSRPMNVIQAGR